MARKKKNRQFRITLEDYLTANRKSSREEEIAAHGKQISMRKVLHKSKKTYDRKSLGKVKIEQD